MSLYLGTVERHSLGGWPDGITPGFVEVGRAPSSSPGFDAPPGSIARFGLLYYFKVGTTPTAWILVSALAPATYESLRRSDLYQCAGVSCAAGAADNPEHSECEGAAAATAAFEPYIFAYPEIMGADGTIVSLGGYAEGGGGAGGFHFWVAAWTSNGTAGNPAPSAPGAASYLYEHPGAGFDGQKFRSGVVSVPVTRGQVVWFLTQTNGPNLQRGYRRGSAFRPVLGETTGDPVTATSNKAIIGLRSAAVAAYDTTITTLPTMQVLPVGNDTVGSGSANTINRPSVYYKFQPS